MYGDADFMANKRKSNVQINISIPAEWKAFDRFFVLHEALISEIVQNYINVCNSDIAV